MSSFNQLPFYTTPAGAELLHNMRLYRPVEAIPSSLALQKFDDRTRSEFRKAGYGDGDVTLLPPDEYEVAIISKGSINLAVMNTPSQLLAHAQAQNVRDVLLEALQLRTESAKIPLSARVERIGVYGEEQDEQKQQGTCYLAAFLGSPNRNAGLPIEDERREGYDLLGLLSGMDQVFFEKLKVPKYAAFRFAAIHDTDHLPSQKLIASLMPAGLLRVILREVRAGAFND